MTLLQRARGHFGLAVRAVGPRTRRADLEQGGCCRLLFPRVAGDSLEAVTVNISGGIAAGDRIEGRIECGPGTDLLVTSQAAERIYRARSDDPAAEMEISCQLAEGARLEWLPHGTIYFDGSRMRRHVNVAMAASSTFLFLETRIFGRIASGETVERLDIRDRLSVRRAGVLLLEDMVRLESYDVAALLNRKAVAAGQVVNATLVLIAPDAEARLVAVRALLEEIHEGSFAASAWNGMLVVRAIAPGSWPLDMAMRRILPVLRDDRPMPATWRS